MTVRITPFSPDSFGPRVPLVGAQSADRIDLTGASAQNTPPFQADAVVNIAPTQDCFVRIGVGAVADPAKAEPWSAGSSDFRLVRKGERVSAIEV